MKWKSKKTLRTEAETYLKLWQEAEEGIRASDSVVDTLGRKVNRLGEDLQRVKYPRTLVLASTHHRARQACDELGINPRGKGVHVILTPPSLEGLRVERGDRVVFVEGWGSESGMMEIWRHNLARSGLTIRNLWISHQ